ncbi:permease [Pseudoteredinibacter isoporae]|uniref:permease n=1 Tax=Pseudoteredinibacter isoporae TaxID=570281 RepID=UPI003107F3C1
MSDCCSKDPNPSSDAPAPGNGCATKEAKPGTAGDSCASVKDSHVSSCCDQAKDKPDWFLRICFVLVLFFYSLSFDGWLKDAGLPDIFLWRLSPAMDVMAHTVHELVNTMWFSVVLAALFVGFLAKIPQSFVLSILGRGGSVGGLGRATVAGVLMDLCSHGILMVAMQLYRKGASLGQVMAFLVASPWNSLSLTLILIALIGWQWTLAFIVLSMILAFTTGYLFDALSRKGHLPENPFAAELEEGFDFWPEAKRQWGELKIDKAWWASVWDEAISGSKMVVRWLLFGVLLAALIRGFVSLDDFQQYFGPSLLGLAATLVAATIIEVCSEGSTPIAADLMTRANAPGNSFAFLMTGVATDYTEVMVIKDTMKSWKTALFLPLLGVPQVVAVAVILNQMA